MTLSFISKQLDFNYQFAEELVKDVPEEMMAHSPGLGLENHPAFTLGHLAVASSMTVNYLGGTADLPELWNGLFRRKGPGDPTLPEKDQTKYPAKEALLREYQRQHDQLKVLLDQREINTLGEWKSWRFTEFLPTELDCILFMCINHESMHLGQLSAWRRAMELPSALGRL